MRANVGKSLFVLGLLVFAAPRFAVAASASPSSVSFGSVPVNTTVTRDVTITVDAGFTLEIASGSGLNAPFSFSFDTCGAGGGFTGPGTCTVKQSFTPTTATASSGSTNVFQCPVGGGSCIPITYAVSGTGVSTASANPSSVAFGNVPINTTATRDVTITVDAGYRTEIASGTGINAPFGFSFDTCGAGGGFTGPGTCTVKERYTPTTATASSGSTNVFQCPVGGGTCIPITYTVSGTGVSTASANPSSVAFGTVPINTTVTRDVTITVDAGYRTEIASGTGINAPFGFSFDTCGAGGGFTGPGTCTVKERYTPTTATASSGSTNVFQCPVGGGTCIPITYTVSGTGVSIASANPSSVAFGTVPINTTVTRDVTITVDAGYRTEIASGTGINAPFGFSFDTCGAGGGFTGPGTCTVKERYTPTTATASSGSTNVFQCPVGGGTCIPITYAVSGTGVSNASANPSSVAFGTVPINTTVTRDVTITVDAGYRTEIASGTGINAPFGFSFDTCGAGGGFTGPGTCTVKERYTPTAATASSGSTNVFQCPVGGGTCIPITYAVSGTGVSNASANPSSVAFGNVPINTTATRSVTITVDAGYSVQLASGTGINAPFSFGFDTCANFAGPGSCTVTQRFTPTALVTSNATTNVFQCPVAGGTCIPIPYSVSGTGVSNASANPSSVAFGNVTINTTATRTVTITVDAGYSVQLASGTGINAPFGFAFGTCANFAGPGTCTVTQRFSPTALVTSNATTNVFQCPVGGGTCVAIPYAVSGTGVVESPNRPPDCSAATFTLSSSVFPIDHGLRSVAATVTDPDGDPVSFQVNTMCQDEQPNFEGILAWGIDGTGIGSATPAVRAEFSGTRTNPSNGRVYHLYFTADDGKGGRCSGELKIGIPTSATGTAIDGGPLYDSTKSTGDACRVPQP